MKVGFIGLGIMGKPMSKNLVKAGHDLVVYDFKQSSIDELVALGAKGAKSGAEVAAECDTIITMVPNSPHVRAACLGENGISDTAKPGTVVIDMSSIDPVESKKIGAELAEKALHRTDLVGIRKTWGQFRENDAPFGGNQDRGECRLRPDRESDLHSGPGAAALRHGANRKIRGLPCYQ